MADGDLARSHVDGKLLRTKAGDLARVKTRTYWRAELTATFTSSSTWGGHSYWEFAPSSTEGRLFKMVMGADGDNAYTFRFPMTDGMETWIVCGGEGPPLLTRLGSGIPFFERTDDRDFSFQIFVDSHGSPIIVAVAGEPLRLADFNQIGSTASFTVLDSFRHTHDEVPTTDRIVDGYLRNGVFYLDMYAPGDYGDPVEHPDASTEYQDFTDEGSRGSVYYWADDEYRDESYFARTDDFECECSCRIVLERLPRHPLCPHT